MPRIPLVEDLTRGPVPAGSSFLVEYDPACQWYAASFTIAAGWLRGGGRVLYGLTTRTPEKLRSQLGRLGTDSHKMEEDGKLRIFDFYTAALGKKSDEKYAIPSLKVADLSIWWSKTRLAGPPQPENLGILDDLSILDRFNDEKTWVEFVLTRIVPTTQLRKETGIRGVMTGVHSGWVYKRLEGTHDGVIEFKLDEIGGQVTNLMRIKNMREIDFDSRWHQLKIGENFEVTLEK